MENTSEVVPSQASASLPSVTVSVDWGLIAELEPRHINQVMAQLGNPTPDGIPDGIYVGLGSVTPPVIQVTDIEAARKVAEQLQGTSVTVSPYGRFHMSRSLLDGVIKTLQIVAEQYDSIVGQIEAAKAQPKSTGE